MWTCVQQAGCGAALWWLREARGRPGTPQPHGCSWASARETVCLSLGVFLRGRAPCVAEAGPLLVALLHHCSHRGVSAFVLCLPLLCGLLALDTTARVKAGSRRVLSASSSHVCVHARVYITGRDCGSHVSRVWLVTLCPSRVDIATATVLRPLCSVSLPSQLCISHSLSLLFVAMTQRLGTL